MPSLRHSSEVRNWRAEELAAELASESATCHDLEVRLVIIGVRRSPCCSSPRSLSCFSGSRNGGKRERSRRRPPSGEVYLGRR